MCSLPATGNAIFPFRRIYPGRVRLSIGGAALYEESVPTRDNADARHVRLCAKDLTLTPIFYFSFILGERAHAGLANAWKRLRAVA